MKDLRNILTWKQDFGLLPIHLYPNQIENNCFIMLNGGYGDFCLKTEGSDNSSIDFNSLSWSSNTKNFIVIGDENVNIYNWQTDNPEIIAKNRVEKNFEKFYKYLVDKSFKSSKDVVPFVIDIFKQFRNLTQEKNNAVEALNLLFILLTSLKEDISNFDFSSWGLSEVEIPSNFDLYTERLKNGISGIKPELDLIIRHSAGALFQEAQKEVLFFDRQIDLWGTFSSKMTSKYVLYSSIHYTPPYLSRTIVENALKQIDLSQSFLKIFDPACGSSEFLIEALKQLHEKRYLGNVIIIGWDVSQTAIDTSNFLLSYEKRTVWKEKLNFEIKLVTDSLKEEWSNDYDLLLMNPPFVSWEQMDKDSREAVRGIFKTKLEGRPNQASAFFYKSVQSLNSVGVIGCVIPSSLLTLDAYQNLRNEVSDQLEITLIGKLGNFVFEDALTDVSFIIGHKPKTNIIPLILWTRNEKGIPQNALRDLRKMSYSEEFKIVEKDYSVYTPLSFPITKENWKPISFQENELFKRIERFVIEQQLVRVQEIFNVQQGIRTGNNAAFKISEAEYNNLPNLEQAFFRPAIDNDSIKRGQIQSVNYVWYPYNEEGIIIDSEEDLINKVPIFYEKMLRDFKISLTNRARKDESTWWHLSEHRAWLRKKQPRLVSTEFGKSDSFAFDKDGHFAIERGNAWLPKKDFKQLDTYYFYLAFFSSPFFDKLLSIYSKQLLSGWDLGKKYTKEIPIPNAHSKEIRYSQAYEQLVDIGKELSEGEYYLRATTDSILLKYIYPEI
ncbi:hypothetical protein AHMF7605_26045 [Adhaeribacter arboris]|uniref:site-specific DNA-methyltransferase (adenine-specific) n=1 Tax=Adhaeribacter arboris TaxID=2072846 RepID=A0A2T2YMH6_9BACT|nr:N-6 DNA methylase [Adhaeribacter arboris]PSR56708.1 hypothetical protein AHMF7605_26045 [Adhaeribacter arboris]